MGPRRFVLTEDVVKIAVSKVDMLQDFAVCFSSVYCGPLALMYPTSLRNKGNSPCSRSTLLHQRDSALADFLKCRFEATKFLWTQFREHSLHLPGMLSKGSSNEVLASWGEGNDPHAPVFGALDPADKALRKETVDSDTDRAWGQIDDWAYRIDGQRPFVQQDFEHGEIRQAEPRIFYIRGCVPRQRSHRLHHYQPDVVRPLDASGHKKLESPQKYTSSIRLTSIYMTPMQWRRIEKENPVMRTASVIARYLAGMIFLVMGLNGFLNFIPLPPPGGIAGQFMGALYVSHYLWVIFA